MENKLAATLKLQNGMEFKGWSFGYNKACDGEVVFSTAMVGYPESLTDPSYSGQILCVTYPLIGNYGVPDEGLDDFGISRNFESEKIWVKGLVISDYSFKYSHWDAVKSLDQWLKEQKIPAIYGLDTREITKILRESGSLLGQIVPEGIEAIDKIKNPNNENHIAIASCKKILNYMPEKPIGKKIVSAVRAAAGGYTCIRAIALPLEEKKQVQVSMNMINYEKTPIHRVFETIKSEANRYNTNIVDTELVGPVPIYALRDILDFYLRISESFSVDQIYF